jgi:hypothetical protein
MADKIRLYYISIAYSYIHILDNIITFNSLCLYLDSYAAKRIIENNAIVFSKYRIVRNKELFLKKLKKHIFNHIITGTINLSIKDNILFFNGEESLAKLYINKVLTSEECKDINNYIENNLMCHIKVYDKEVCFKNKKKAQDVIKYLSFNQQKNILYFFAHEY